MQAVHFGAGNIGRGFIGALLYQAGYHTTFVDVNEDLVNEINKQQQYTVVLAAEKPEKILVQDVSAINSSIDSNAVKHAIAEADIVTTAIGPHILPFIAELIAQGLIERLDESKQPLNIIACENMVGGSSFLKEKVFEYIPEDKQSSCEELFGFPDAAVDRIVPDQKNSDILEVAVEPYHEWLVESKGFRGDQPAINGMTYVKKLQPYIERKLFTVNTGHAVPAFFGYLLGYETIVTSMQDKKVLHMIQAVLDETGEMLIQTYGFDREQHEAYKQTIIERFKNPYISDKVTRVCRNPLRKLGPDDRFIHPATAYADALKRQPEHLAELIAAVLLYSDKGDEEARTLQQLIADKGYEAVLMEVSGLKQDNPLIQTILDHLQKLKVIHN